MCALDFRQKPVEKGPIEARQWNCSSNVDGAIKGELGAFDEVEYDCVLETNQRVANVAEVERRFGIEQVESHPLQSLQWFRITLWMGEERAARREGFLAQTFSDNVKSRGF
jgi:hypothetical protein